MPMMGPLNTGADTVDMAAVASKDRVVCWRRRWASRRKAPAPAPQASKSSECAHRNAPAREFSDSSSPSHAVDDAMELNAFLKTLHHNI